MNEYKAKASGLMFGPYATPRDYEKAIQAALLAAHAKGKRDEYARGWNAGVEAAAEAADEAKQGWPWDVDEAIRALKLEDDK